MPKKPTLRDVAREADVALSTVSQVMNNKPNVSAGTREHVLKIAQELGYRHKIETNSHLPAKLSTVGLLTKSSATEQLFVNPFYSHIIAGAERECQRQNINLMYANMQVDERNHAISMPSMLLGEIVDGVIVVGAFLEETLTQISRRAGRNVVLVDAYTSDDNAFDSVLINNVQGAQTAVSYLIEHGHRKIGLIGSSDNDYPSIRERRQGYMMALLQNGIQETFIEPCRLDRVAAFEATVNLLQRCPEITAIFACNDNVAFGVMNAARHLGRDIPGDLSIVGFDDIDLAQEVMPSLTTIHVDKGLMGTLAVRQLYDRAASPDRATIKALVSTQLIERETVKKLGD